MTTRQYFGARYIPVFADPVEWTDERTYEPLMMVQHLGETYMTKQAVPLGVQLPDTSQGEDSNEYWVHMSNWNAQIETYRQEVLQYNGRISTLENDLPIADFDSTNTVKKAIDDAVALLPGTAFDSTNTVHAALQELQRQDSMRTIVFENVSNMKLSEDIEDGIYVRTLGFNAAGDGGAALYAITDTGTANEMDVIACGDLYANLIVENDIITPEMLGAFGNGNADDHDAFERAIEIAEDKYEIHLNSKVYYLATPISIASNVTRRISIHGTGQGQNSLSGSALDKHIKYSIVKVYSSFMQGADASNSKVSGIISGVGFVPTTTSANSTAYVFDTLTLSGFVFDKCFGRWIGTIFKNVGIYGTSRIQNNVFFNALTFIKGSLIDSYVQNNYISGDASAQTVCFDFDDSDAALISGNFFDYFKFMYKGRLHQFVSSNNVYEIFGNMIDISQEEYNFNSIGDAYYSYDHATLQANTPDLVTTIEGAFVVGGPTNLTVTNPMLDSSHGNGAYFITRNPSNAFYPAYNYSQISLINPIDISPVGGSFDVLRFVNFPNSYHVDSYNDPSQRWWINVECASIPQVNSLPADTDTIWRGMKVLYNNNLYIYTGTWKQLTS